MAKDDQKVNLGEEKRFDLRRNPVVELEYRVIAQEKVIEKLRECLDPELGINIVDLGLIYSVNIDGSRIYILMTMTTPGCPLDAYFVKDITTKLKSVKGVSDVSVEMTFDPPWTPVKMSQESKDLLGFVN